MGLQDIDIYLLKGINAIKLDKVSIGLESLSQARQMLNEYLNNLKMEESNELYLLRDNGWEFTYEGVFKGNIRGGAWIDPESKRPFKTKTALRIQKRRTSHQV